jgi:hypothetical protein
MRDDTLFYSPYLFKLWAWVGVRAQDMVRGSSISASLLFVLHRAIRHAASPPPRPLAGFRHNHSSKRHSAAHRPPPRTIPHTENKERRFS